MAGHLSHDVRGTHKVTKVPETTRHKPSGFHLDTASVVDLQRVIGNQAVQRLLINQGIQAKMTVGAADDSFEREADSVASQVMSGGSETAGVQREGMPEEELPLKRMPQILQRAKLGEDEEIAAKRDLQRAPEDEEIALKRDIQRAADDEFDESMPLQTKGDDLSGSFDVEGDIESSIQTQKGGGQSLGGESQSFFADRMGHDFSGVNVHTDAQSDALNQSLGSRAFTTGNDIFFRSGEYNPGNSGGQELLAHELTHVVQQTGGAPVQPKRDDNDCC
jgi:hypothetical protein